MRSQVEVAPSRGGAEDEPLARGGRGLGVVVDPQLEGAEMALGRGDRALEHREIGRARRRDVVGLRRAAP